jgi:TolA-binding protein
MRSITSALLVTVAFVAVATAPYLVFHDDSFARLIDHQTQTQTQVQISYDDQIDDLRAQIERMSRLDQERMEEIKSLRQRQETLEQVTSGLAKDRLIQAAIQARNGLPSGTNGSAPALSSIKTTSGNSNVETGKQAEKTTTSDNKKARVSLQRQAPVVRKRTQEAPSVAAGRNAIEPVSQQNY